MDMIIRPAVRAHSFLLFGVVSMLIWSFTMAGSAWIIGIIFASFYGLLLAFSVKGLKYRIKDGLLTKKHWNGPEQSIRLNQIQQSEIKYRSLNTGDIILYTHSGKFKIVKVSEPKKIHDLIMAVPN